MARRKGEDTLGAKRRRMPWVAKIKREDPFRPEDSNELYAQCKRIAASAEHFSAAGWREDSGYRLFYFTTWAKARALQHWIDRSGIAHRPMPKLGPSAEEIEEEKREALTWGLETRAVRSIVQTYRRAMYRGASHLSAFNEATEVALALGRPNDKTIGTTEVLLEWAKANHPAWFARCLPPQAGAATPRVRSERAASRAPWRSPAPAAELPRWRPAF
jgi:hypothetical protein